MAVRTGEAVKRFAELARSEVRRLFQHIRRRLESVEDAEDVLQEVLLAFWRHLDLFGPVDDAAAWLYRTASNKIADWHRKRYRSRPGAGPVQSAADADARWLWELADADVGTPQDEAARQELREAILRAIEGLPPEQREVFVLHEMEGLSFDAISARTGVPVNTLLSRKRYAVAKLRKALSDVYESHREE
jgi:RNA polymerase sigma factor (sigma-70 family)